MVLIVYCGYELMERKAGGYRSVIDGEVLVFDTAGQWKQFIDRRYEKREKKNNRN